MRRIQLIGCLTLAVGFMMISVGITIQNENSIAKSGNMKVQEFDIKDIAASANRAISEPEQQVVQEKKEVTKLDITMDISPASMQREEVYGNMTLEEVADQLNKSLKNDIAGKGMVIATKSIELGVDPFVATAIIMHETGCGQSQCSNIARNCYNFGGQKGSGCGSYKRYSSVDEGLEGMVQNLYRNYYAYGLNTVEAIGPKYAESTTWVGMINWYVDKIKNK